jgi:hypothetical protein
MSTAPGTFTTKISRALSPECDNLSKTVKMTSLISLVVLVIAFLLIVFALLYNYMQKPHSNPVISNPTATDRQQQQPAMEDAHDNNTMTDKQQKLLHGMSIATSAAVVIDLIAKLWDYKVSAKTIKLCLGAN